LNISDEPAQDAVSWQCYYTKEKEGKKNKKGEERHGYLYNRVRIGIELAKRELCHEKMERTNGKAGASILNTVWTTWGGHGMRKAWENICASMIGSVMTDQFGLGAAKMRNASHEADE
jgi:hypothetical protein